MLTSYMAHIQTYYSAHLAQPVRFLGALGVAEEGL